MGSNIFRCFYSAFNPDCEDNDQQLCLQIHTKRINECSNGRWDGKNTLAQLLPQLFAVPHQQASQSMGPEVATGEGQTRIQITVAGGKRDDNTAHLASWPAS